MLVQGFDHFVVPVNDIVVAEVFYAQIFGGKIVKRVGLNVRSQSLGPHTFITIAGKRIGVYLQKEERSTPITPQGTPTYSFTTTAQGLQDLTRALHHSQINFLRPLKNTHPF